MKGSKIWFLLTVYITKGYFDPKNDYSAYHQLYEVHCLYFEDNNFFKAKLPCDILSFIFLTMSFAAEDTSSSTPHEDCLRLQVRSFQVLEL